MRKTALTISAFLLLAAVLLFYRVSLTSVYQSDNASALLMAKDMVQHNWLLHGWMLPSDNYLFTDLIFYLPLVAILHTDVTVIRIVGVFLLTLVAGFSFYVAMLDQPQAKAKIAPLLTFVLMACSSLFLLQHELSIPIHTGSLLFGLVTFSLFLSWEKTAAYLPLAGMAFLAALGFFSDPQFLIIGVAPVLAVTVKKRQLRQLWPAGALILGVLVGHTGLSLYQTHGAHLVDQPFIFASLSTMLSNLLLFVDVTFRSFDAYFFGHNALEKSTLLLLLNVIKVAVILLPAWWYTKKAKAKQKLSTVDDLLFGGALLTFLAFVASTYAHGEEAVRYLFPVFVFLAILAGRQGSEYLNSRPRQQVAGVLGVLFVLIFLRHLFTAPQPQNPSLDIASSKVRELKSGYGSYWLAASTTVYSQNALTVSPVKIIDGQFFPYYWFSANAWYQQPAYFLVYDAKNDPDFATTAVQVFGSPKEHVLISGSVEALTWDHNITPQLKHYEGLEQ